MDKEGSMDPLGGENKERIESKYIKKKDKLPSLEYPTPEFVVH